MYIVRITGDRIFREIYETYVCTNYELLSVRHLKTTSIYTIHTLGKSADDLLAPCESARVVNPDLFSVAEYSYVT